MIPVILAATESLTEHPMGILLGFVFVVLVLALLALATSLMGRVFIASENKAKAAAVAPPVPAHAAPAPMQAVDQDAVDSRIAAVIAAAVYTTLGSGHRVVSIRIGPNASGWAAEGRREIFSSRHIRKVERR